MNLFGLEGRVDRHEHDAGRRGAEHGDDRLDALVEKDREPLALGDLERLQPLGERQAERRECAIGEPSVAGDERLGIGRAACRLFDQIEEITHDSTSVLKLGRRTSSDAAKLAMANDRRANAADPGCRKSSEWTRRAVAAHRCKWPNGVVPNIDGCGRAPR
ncbi:hypothetical protein X895_3630 [Burkholderia pseudomallei MSHR4503]|nr:hypothetical protein X895_3630 [Burkholderia pseudomallei MSHR4503]